VGYIGFLISAVSLVFMLVAIIPFHGWLNWFLVPFVCIGLVTSLMGVQRNNGRVLGFIGTIVCSIVLIISAIRLIIGGGII